MLVMKIISMLKKLWNEFRINTMEGFHHLHLKTDILLLSGVFEQFRNMYLQTFILNPCLYSFSPGLPRDPIFKITNTKLELTRDADIYEFIE